MLRAWRRFRGHRIGLAAAFYVAALVAIAILAPLLPGLDPHRITNNVMQAPSWLHLLGTDELGRDVLTGIVFGVRVSMTVGFAAALAATLIGTAIGAVAGYYEGVLDMLVMRISEIFQVIPSFILAAVIVALSGPGLSRVVMVIALLAWPQIARLMRGEVMRVKQLEFVDAVRCLGVRESAILTAEIIPNALAPVLAAGTLIIAQAILLEAALSFLGLSDADLVSWGRMLNSGQRFLFNAWWLSVFPGTAIFVTVLAFNLLGDAIGSALNPRLAK
ncbi:MAG TPA: ABC transporter permease [Stellaceae bacterium]|nr:ABC transporter permease [Stellaceae bacterium]